MRVTFTLALVVVALISPFANAVNKPPPNLVCYYFNPSHPYVDPSRKELFHSVVADGAIYGSLSGSFFVASEQQRYDEMQRRCNAQIPQGHSLLSMKVVSGEREYPISFNEASQQKAFKRIVVIGDSLSEEGRAVSALQSLRNPRAGATLKIAKLLGCEIPEHFLDFGLAPYWNGMFSNGPMWPRYLSEFLENAAVDNLAFGGVTTGRRKCHTMHLHSILKRHFKGNQDAAFVAENLYIIWLGANNYHYPKGLPPMNQRVRKRGAAVSKAMGDLAKSVNALIEHGAQRIVLFTVPNPQESPDWQLFFGADHAARREEWRAGVKLHNEALRESFAQMQGKWGARVSLFDVDAILQENEGAFGMDPAILFKDEHSRHPYQELIQEPGYFDPFHPTTKIHCLIARKLVRHLYELGYLDAGALWSQEMGVCEDKIAQLIKPTAS
jgi:phospholipase/lecithinase/hemolysin